MKTTCLLALAAATIGLTVSSAHAINGANTEASKLEIKRSEFTPLKGKDPFFPKVEKHDVTKPERELTSKDFRVTAFSVSPGKRVCNINDGKPLTVGEEVTVSTPMGKTLIRCVEINDATVTIALPNSVQFTIPVRKR